MFGLIGKIDKPTSAQECPASPHLSPSDPSQESDGLITRMELRDLVPGTSYAVQVPRFKSGGGK